MTVCLDGVAVLRCVCHDEDVTSVVACHGDHVTAFSACHTDLMSVSTGVSHRSLDGVTTFVVAQ